MPFVYKKMQNSPIEADFNKSLVTEYSKILTLVLGLSREPVGVKLIFTKEEYESYDIEEPKNKLSYCKYIELAGQGKSVKTLIEHHLCDGATTALALEHSTDKIESGEEYFSYDLYATKAVARRVRDSVDSLHRDMPLTYGILIAPLNKIPVAPDTVMVLANPKSIMRIVQGYMYHFGVKPKLDYGAMQALCSELTVVPYKTGGLNISALCPSTRTLCKWDDSEMGTGIAFERFLDTVDGIIKTLKTTETVKVKAELNELFKKEGIDIFIEV